MLIPLQVIATDQKKFHPRPHGKEEPGMNRSGRVNAFGP